MTAVIMKVPRQALVLCCMSMALLSSPVWCQTPPPSSTLTCGIDTSQALAACLKPTSALHGSVPAGTAATDPMCIPFNGRMQNYASCIQKHVNDANANEATGMTEACAAFIYGSCLNQYSYHHATEKCCANTKTHSSTLPDAEKNIMVSAIELACRPAVNGKALQESVLNEAKQKTNLILCNQGDMSSAAPSFTPTRSPFHTFLFGMLLTYLTSALVRVEI